MADTPEKGPHVGTYKDVPIPAWFRFPDRAACRYVYVGIAAEDRDGGIWLSQLDTDEVVVSPGLIYRAKSNASPLAAVQTGRPARMGGRT